MNFFAFCKKKKNKKINKIDPSCSHYYKNEEIKKDELHLKDFYPDGYESKPFSNLWFKDRVSLALKGCALGDCAGRVYEAVSPLSCREEVSLETLFHNGFCLDCTDDTILTCATLEALLDTSKKEDIYEFSYKKYAQKYPLGNYGGRFISWVNGGVNPESCGNGSAMRISPCGCFEKIEDTVNEAYKSAICTHSHPEGVKGAVVTAACIWMAFHEYSKKEIGEYCSSQYPDSPYAPSISYKEIYKYDRVKGNPALCQVTVPMAINCFVHSDSFEDCILKAIHMGWDTDTQAAIAGSIAMAYYQECSGETEEAWKELKELPYIKNIDSFF